jgi:transposase
VRATTACNKLLAIPGADVTGVVFTPTGIVVSLRRRSRRLRCPCGWSTRAVYDRTIRRWRHLDLGAARLLLQAEIRRLACRACGRVRTETVPWAHPGSRFTRDFEAVVVSLAQRTDTTTSPGCCAAPGRPWPPSRCGWSPPTSMTPAWTGCTGSASTRPPTARATAT